MKHVIIGTAGHVDHGKTTLIRALTGINTDRLAEEQARGMTIDLGFAFLTLPGEIQAGIVDVPGHERFVKNMLAGAGGIDVALVVIAADEGPMPQTREHLDILTVLGVTQGVVALTKTDIADPEIREIAEMETIEALAKTPLAGCPVVPISAQTGVGLEALKVALGKAAAACAARDATAPVRLPVDRVFSLPGVGTVVTGTLISGTLRVGEALVVEPQGISTKARTLQTHGAKVESATPGMRLAVNIPGVEVGDLERGAVLASVGLLKATTRVDICLALLPDAARAVRHRERVRLHLGTGETLARVVLLDGEGIAPGQEAPVQLLCEAPIAPVRGERLVVRSYSPARAIGGGVVVDPLPARKYRRGDEAARRLFESRSEGVSGAIYAALCAQHVQKTPAELAKETGVEPEVVVVTLEALADTGKAVTVDGAVWLSDNAATRLKETAMRTIATFHRQNPYRKALPKESLRTPLAKAATVKDFNALMAWLSAEGICVAEGSGVRLPDHAVTLPAPWQKAANHLADTYKAAGFQPPNPGDFVRHFPRDVVIPLILLYLTDEGILVALGEDLYLHRDTYETAKRLVKGLTETPEGITVGTVRDATGSSRKVILPLLEHFDAVRFTQRVGDKRLLLERVSDS